MIINWYGEGCFKIQASGVTILTDPFESSIGLTPPRFKADLNIKTLVGLPIEMSKYRAPETEAAVVVGAGEYEVKGLEISGFLLSRESNEKFVKSAYLVKTEDLKLGLLGHLSEGLEPNIVEKLEGVDALFVPAGGKPFIDQEALAKLIKQLQPKLVIPSFYKVPGLKRPTADIKVFAKALDQKIETQEKLTVKKKDLSEKTTLVVLKV
ncbi:MAG: hypothetical protein A2745_03000 [Candidatus Harrisonbacteria bacterium RIFCSPHIGHO2_01_FULL_44_13]|nr:MAG: hypothetical protein A2745_03000 [Candidatus Harrisonbacteria bacterium RIFCSPHIGHO2_01_FULL_44_13]